MSPNPLAFLGHLRAKGYHPRSNKHSNALAEAIVRDLVAVCPVIRTRAQAGELVYDLNFTLQAGTSDWNVDLVVGPPPPGSRAPDNAIRRSQPSTVQIAIEIKSVMTEHRKAIRNRKRDLEAHHDHVHRYSRRVVAGGVLIVNQSATFLSPLRQERTTHTRPAELVALCINQIRAVAERQAPHGEGMDAKAVIVVDMDNEELASTAYVTGGAAPHIGDPLHYDAFVQRLCDVYQQRFS
ncbi:MAG: hypothetical protein KAX44_06190 [Candidatus Brocadiae bacterium]|nr:hypothetical protein [Candidatus Brocadiia bacterium]